MADTAKELRELEARVDALVADLSNPSDPAGARAILRSISSLLMAARWQVEDQQYGPLPTVDAWGPFGTFRITKWQEIT